ncbi:MAG: hypothetical protein J3R72DRAFT_440825 [Linnemannia gamsii]|nr:MAG: hypothetical protein J3R72DRAFT_440825 [Linnemannia gamsii]
MELSRALNIKRHAWDIIVPFLWSFCAFVNSTLCGCGGVPHYRSTKKKLPHRSLRLFLSLEPFLFNLFDSFVHSPPTSYIYF